MRFVHAAGAENRTYGQYLDDRTVKQTALLPMNQAGNRLQGRVLEGFGARLEEAQPRLSADM